MKVLLTGGSGFIGGALKATWQDKYDLRAPAHGELDLLDGPAVESYLAENRFDAVVHTANTNDFVHPELAAQQLERNMQMFCNLQRCGKLYGKMLYFGSGAEYDRAHYVPRMTEDYFGRHVPADPYGLSKYRMALLAARSENVYDLRLFGVFGPGEEWRRRFISNMIYQALQGGVLHMDRNVMFDYLYVRDLIPMVEWFLHHTPRYRHYNVCSGREYSLRALADAVRRACGTEAEVVMTGTDWKPAYSGSDDRFTAEAGEFPLTPMEDAIAEMVRFYRENGFH